MINFILMLIGFFPTDNMSPDNNNTIPYIQQNVNPGTGSDNIGGPVGGNSGQLPPPFIQP